VQAHIQGLTGFHRTTASLSLFTEAPMFWLFLLTLMLLIPAIVGVQTWREVRRSASAGDSQDEPKALPAAQ
jgi:hypothetical protein